jgi:hypothetical protein
MTTPHDPPNGMGALAIFLLVVLTAIGALTLTHPRTASHPPIGGGAAPPPQRDWPWL